MWTEEENMPSTYWFPAIAHHLYHSSFYPARRKSSLFPLSLAAEELRKHERGHKKFFINHQRDFPQKKAKIMMHQRKHKRGAQDANERLCSVLSGCCADSRGSYCKYCIENLVEHLISTISTTPPGGRDKSRRNLIVSYCGFFLRRLLYQGLHIYYRYGFTRHIGRLLHGNNARNISVPGSIHKIRNFF